MPMVSIPWFVMVLVVIMGVMVLMLLVSMLVSMLPAALEALDVPVVESIPVLRSELELLVPPPDIRPVDDMVASVATPSDMPCIAAFGAARLFGART